MREFLLREPYSCAPVCRMAIALEPLTSPMGPAGDRLHVALRITGGRVFGVGSDKNILGGDDFAIMYADEKLIHDGRFVVEDPAGQLPASAPCRLSVELVSTTLAWRTLGRRPLLGVGSFDGPAGRLEITILSVTENDGRN